MSNVLNNEEAIGCEESPCQSVKMIIHPKQKDLGGFSVRRVLPYAKQRMVGPWLFFDHMGPANFKAGDGINVRPHPHIHLATVTYLFEGEILHRDSLGTVLPISPGDINLMVAGKGIVHSERERPEVTQVEHRLHGLQLWMALPEAQQNIDPAFYHYESKQIPSVSINDVAVRVMMGSAYGAQSPVKTFAETLYIEANLSAGQQLELPNAPERALYAAMGSVSIEGKSVEEFQMAVLSENKTVTVMAKTDARIALIGGEKMAPRHMFWNFASTSKQSIEQARQAWQDGRFPTIPGDDKEFIPLP